MLPTNNVEIILLSSDWINVFVFFFGKIVFNRSFSLKKKKKNIFLFLIIKDKFFKEERIFDSERKKYFYARTFDLNWYESCDVTW